MSTSIRTRAYKGTVFRDVQLDSGSIYSHDQCRDKAAQGLRAFQRWFHRSLATLTTWEEEDLGDFELQYLDWLLDDVESYLGAAREALREREGDHKREEKVQKLKALAERTTFPGEAQAAREAAERLQRS